MSDLENKNPCLFRNRFRIPTFESVGIGDSQEEVTYLCGNSLGLMPVDAEANVLAELDVWAKEGVLGHHKRFDGRDPWVCNDVSVAKRLADLIFGCFPSEISFTGTLTTNLNAMLQAFYRPTPTRFKLMCERKAFPSDIYCFQNQIRLHGLNIDDTLVLLDSKEGSDLITTEQVLEAIEQHGSSLALVCLPGIQYYTGQYFDIAAITEATKRVGSVSGWDLAHASGNVPLKLHDWGCDFAVFCSYKYLNCGAGNLGGIFVHEKIAKRYASEPRPAGWWGVDLSTRFDMDFNFVPAPGARGFTQSNVCLFGPACMHASLDVFEAAGGVKGLSSRRKSLVGYLVSQLKSSQYYGTHFYIMTDVNKHIEGMDGLDRADEHGCQVSIKFTSSDPNLLPRIVDELTQLGIIGDERKPNVLRWAPNPLYNTHQEVKFAADSLTLVLSKLV